MKKILLAAFALGLTMFTNAQTWIQQNSGITSQLNAVKFTDSQNGWAVGDGGVILNTTNGGTTWTNINNIFSSSPINFTELDVINNNIWVCTDNALILYSNNAGTTWSVSTTPTVSFGTGLSNIDFVNQNDGWAIGGGSTSGIVFKTNDGGINWTSVTNVPTLSNLPKGVSVANSSTIYITDGGMIKKTTDGGANWVFINVATNIMKPIALNANDVWCIQGLNNSQFAFKTINGNTFNSFSSTLPINGYLINIDAVDINNVVLANYTGSNYDVYRTINGGINWISTNLGNINGYINDISYPDVNNAWVVGNNGNIYKYNSFATNLKEEKNKVSLNLYPNPSKNSINIDLENLHDKTTVYLINALGDIVLSENVTTQNSKINIEHLPSGVYLLNLNGIIKKIIKE